MQPGNSYGWLTVGDGKCGREMKHTDYPALFLAEGA